jgi:hypothetical protein
MLEWPMQGFGDDPIRFEEIVCKMDGYACVDPFI